MWHYLFELALLLLAAYFAGACIGCLLRKLFGGEEIAAPAAIVAAPAAAAAAVAPRMVEPVVAPRAAAPAYVPPPAPVVPPPPMVKAAQPVAAAAPVVENNKVERPKGIAAARGGKADNLQRISGIGPKNEKILLGLGFFHFDQIAAWTAGQVSWVDEHLRFNGRIKREDWIRQARLLADGKEAEFAKLFGAGTRTRKS